MHFYIQGKDSDPSFLGIYNIVYVQNETYWECFIRH